MMSEHYRNLEHMYLNAPVQNLYTGIGIKVAEGRSFITLPVQEKFFHAANSLHGSVYFRLLDDAAFFAVASLVTDTFVLTSSFQIDILRPVTSGNLVAEGVILNAGRNMFLSKADLYDDRRRLVATGKGTFMKSKVELKSVKGYEKNDTQDLH